MLEMLTTKDMWQSFILSNESTQLNLPEHIVESWRYCTTNKVNPYQDKGIQRVSLERLKETKSELQRVIRLVESEIARLQHFFDVKKPLFILTDKNGVVIWREGHTETRHSANDIHFLEGNIWTEKAVGTNAIGIALRTLQGVTVERFEHFSKASHPFTCTSTPILNDEGNVIACLNISTNEQLQETTYTLMALQMIAQNVQDQLTIDYYTEQKHYLMQLLSEPFEQGVLCNKHGQVIAVSKEFSVDEKHWQGKDISRFMTKHPETYQKMDVREGREVVGYFYHYRSSGITTSYVSFGIESKNSAYQTFLKQLLRAADSDLPIHIYGETGTGKEVSAKTIHYNSRRKDEKMLAINCGALSENLLESELFGYAPGSFTGAQAKGHQGKFEQVKGGTLFLDEIDSMSPRMQVSLLRVLEEKRIMPIGGTEEVSVDFRLVTASNRDLKEQVIAGKFREDLFYRLYVIPLSLPPLRERQEDISVLTHHYCVQHQWYPKWIEGVLDIAKEYEWTGNIREFHNFLDRLSLFYETTPPNRQQVHELIAMGALVLEKPKNHSESEPAQIERALEKHHYHMTRTAEALNIARSTLYRKIDKYQIEIPKD